jgi:hypothetical protein
MSTQRIASGQTPAGTTAWQVYTANAVFVDVNTTSGQFSSAPIYVTSLGGNSSHWQIVGATSIYSPTATGFRVYIRWLDGNPLTPAQANAIGLHIKWHGISA